MDDLLQEFIAETRETLEALSGEIVAWEAAPTDRARLDAIFRFVHTVKGSCGFLDLPRLARLSHAAEDVLAAVRDGTRVPDTHLVNAVLAIVDRIGEIVEAIDAGAGLDDSSEDLLIAALSGEVAPVAAAGQPSGQRTASRSVRLNVDLLDRMMSGMSEMVLARNELARRLRDETLDPRLEAALEARSGPVLVDADHVERAKRRAVYDICRRHGARPAIVWCRCDDGAEIARRLARRRGREREPEHEASDASVVRHLAGLWEDPRDDRLPGGAPVEMVVWDTRHGGVTVGTATAPDVAGNPVPIGPGTRTKFSVTVSSSRKPR